MIMRFTAAVGALLAAAGVVHARLRDSPSAYQLKESHHVPAQWTRVGDAPKAHMVNLNIGLKQGNWPELERHLYEVSDPDSPRYGQHLSAEHVNSLAKPHETTLEAVHEWLDQHDVPVEHRKHNAAMDWLSIKLPVERVESLLRTKYSIWRHQDGSHLIRTPSWSLPKHLHDMIETIQPTNSFFRGATQRSTLKPLGSIELPGAPLISELIAATQGGVEASNTSQVCNDGAVTSACLRTFYKTINYKAQVPGLSKVGLTNYLNETNNRSDTSIFLRNFRPEAAKAAYDFKTIQIANGDIHQTPNTPAQFAAGQGIEGNLDVETVLGIAYPLPLTAYNTGGEPPFQPDAKEATNSNEPYLEWVNYVLAQDAKDVPQVISTSYGDDEQTVPKSYATKVCQQFAQLGARGVTLVFSSGDNGVGENGTCFSNDGKRTRQFVPSFPASCPFVTSIGATKNFSPEVAAFDPNNGFTSGAGFSNYFTQPTYQQNAVAGYLKGLGSTYKGLYNASGRAYPDISANGQSYVVVYNGTGALVDGTSASTPAVGAILALVNDALLAAGHAPLGFLNPWLYKSAYKTFNDITSGSSSGCETSGFAAAASWDPVTGFGTPDFVKLKDLALGQTKYRAQLSNDAAPV